MSHNVKVNIRLRDLDAAAAAITRLGGELKLGQKTHRYYAGQRQKCDHAIALPGSEYEIGLTQTSDGFQPAFDNFGASGRALEAAFGINLSKLNDEYAAEVAMRQLARQGFRTTRTDAPLVNA